MIKNKDGAVEVKGSTWKTYGISIVVNLGRDKR